MKTLVINLRELFKIFQQVSVILTKKQKKQSIWVFANMLLAAVIDTLGVTAILPFITALTDTNKVRTKWYVVFFAKIFNVNSDKGIMIMLGIMIILIYIVKNLYLWLYQCIQIRYQCNVQQELSTTMLTSYMKRKYNFFRNTNSSILLRGVDTDIAAVYNIISNMFIFASQCITVIMIAGYLIVLDPVMAGGLLLASFASIILITALFRNRVSVAGNIMQQSNAERYNAAFQAFNGIKEISVMQRKQYFIDKYVKTYSKLTKQQITFLKIQASPIRIIEATFITFIIGTVCIRINQGIDAIAYVPQLSAFAVAGFRMLPMVTVLPSCLNALIFYRAPLEEAYENIVEARKVDQMAFDIVDHQNIVQGNLQFNSEVVIKDISFKFDDGIKNVIDDLSLTFKKGESIGLIGESGAGKSTLADILMGLQKSDKGSITVDGEEIYNNPTQWSKLVGYIPQTVFLIDDTIKRNITFGINDDEINEEKVWEALAQAQLKDFVQKLPDGLDTIVGERGIKFSGGQRQRIAIARALYYDPQILVMDEATAALDNETEAAVMEEINRLHGDKTLIIVAHRLTTIQNCDQIYEIKNGKAYSRDKKEVIPNAFIESTKEF